MPTPGQLRKTLRQKRRQLSATQAHSSARQMARLARSERLVSNSWHISAYLANDGEIDPLPLMQDLWSMGKTLYLPVLAPFSPHELWFAQYEPGDPLVSNRFGILEPYRRRLIKPRYLDLVLTPLVAFDTHGQRLGMGGGYYDTSFAFLGHRQHWRKPVMLGLGYDFQKQTKLSTNEWDIPLHTIVTETRVYRTRVKTA